MNTTYENILHSSLAYPLQDDAYTYLPSANSYLRLQRISIRILITPTSALSDSSIATYILISPQTILQ